MSIIPRDYQVQAVDAVFDYLNGNRGNPLVAMPTATGKSVVIALFSYRALGFFPRCRIICLTHVKELIQQNYNKLKQAWPNAPAGMMSAGLRRRDTNAQILFAGVQTMVNSIAAVGWVDVVLIDEAHLVSPEDESRYQIILDAWRKMNPALRVVGFTATWWRKKQGALTNDGVFTDVCIDMTRPEDFRRFVAEGYLSPLVARATQTKLDLSSVGISNGDFNSKQLEAALDNDDVTQAALREVVLSGEGRRAWLMFCSGISHAEHVADTLNRWGVRTGVVHSKLGSSARDEVLTEWYAGRLRCVTNNNVLTTGIDYPAIDLIGMLRPTLSSSLWVQMLGRGMRISPGKPNCLVLDFAGNTMRLGPVDDPEIPGKPRIGPAGDAPVKICPQCNTYNYSSVRFCEGCGHEFKFEEKLSAHFSDLPLMSSDLPVIETFRVDSVNYTDHMSRAGKRCIRVMYHCGLRVFNEYVSIGGEGFALVKARDWWMKRHFSDAPDTVEEALAHCAELRCPRALRVWVNTKYPEIMQHIWEDYYGN